MNRIYDAIQGRVPALIEQGLAETLARGVEGKKEVMVFFRADDIGVPGHNFTRMVNLFVEYQLPLCLAVVPTWLTRQRWEALEPLAEKGGDLLCWHQHGWRHCNHETQGKKQEFGPGRPASAATRDLERGEQRLEALLNRRFDRFFTPPWNRCTRETMDSLVKLGFDGISRSAGSRPGPPEMLKEYSVHVDLHTRKESSAALGWDAFFNELSQGLATGVCGIMLHHRRMDEPAFIFLESLLKAVAVQPKIKGVTFTTLAAMGV